MAPPNARPIFPINQQTYQDALYAETRAREQAEYDAMINATAACKSDAELAQSDMQRCYATGDSAGMADAQRRMRRAEARLSTLEGGKEALDAKPTGSIRPNSRQRSNIRNSNIGHRPRQN